MTLPVKWKVTAYFHLLDSIYFMVIYLFVISCLKYVRHNRALKNITSFLRDKPDCSRRNYWREKKSLLFPQGYERTIETTVPVYSMPQTHPPYLNTTLRVPISFRPWTDKQKLKSFLFMVESSPKTTSVGCVTAEIAWTTKLYDLCHYVARSKFNTKPRLRKISQTSNTFVLFTRGYYFHLCCFGNLSLITL